MAEEKEKSSIEDLLDLYEFVSENPEQWPGVYHYYQSCADLEFREDLSKVEHKMTDEQRKILENLDKKVVRGLRKYPAELNRDYVENDSIKKWWWHLDKIQEGTYPAELLPDHLKEEYYKLHPELKPSKS
ncbi:hypothetical protein [Hippea alviniae]|uniref:hypothetical protein n=1 Tax=Hippea alviniae TaxID=1279027 RepID=UPI0003B31E12|nr:hypothetical protein [Hippea alviniae]